MKLGSERESTPREENILSSLLENPTKEWAYVLGFLWADGYLIGKYGIGAEMLSSDYRDVEPIFDYVCPWLKSSRRRKGRRMQSAIRIANKPLALLLDKHGYRTKSESCPRKILELIPRRLRYMWWRGFFDGDGCFYTNKKHYTYQVAITASFACDWEFRRSDLISEAGIKKVTIRRDSAKNGNKYSQLRITNHPDCLTFFNYIYRDYDGIGLSRKYLKHMELKTSTAATVSR